MAKLIKPLDQQIEEYRNDSRFHTLFERFDWKTNSHNTHTAWNWDDEWDGQLIRDVQALEQAGFTIVSFSRKRKVTLKTPVEYQKRDTIVYHITKAVGDSWYSISFKPTLSIYWKGRSSSWNYLSF